MAPARNAQLEQEKEEYRASIAEALQEDEDPLAAYDDFVKWTLQQYLADDVSSGLIELLEECTRRFKDDMRYKGDLRYLKLWSAYAKQVEKPTVIYSYLIKHDIGCVYALLYEEFAGALEKEGRHTEADKVFRIGITRNARPIERLKKRYRDFQARPSSSKSKSASSTFKPSGSQGLDALRRNPFKNYDSSPSSSSNSKPSSSSSPNVPPASASPATHARYAPMLAPPVPGRRPEKLRFNLSLLFTEDGIEYSAAEVRARSMGLLNKKWGPPPSSESRELIRVNFNDDGTRSTQNMGYGKRKNAVIVGEPTVTINTKEALADVFGMYNSPDKTVKRMMPGSKHAPVKRIEPMTPAIRQPSPVVHVENNENVRTPGAFKPFVDENANRKENSTPAAKFKPFTDEAPKQTFITPDSGRRALTTKDSTAATSLKQPTALKSISEDNPGQETENANVKANVFSRVFTPVSHKELLTRPNAHGAKISPRNENAGILQPPISKQDAAPFVPFDSKAPFRVFSRPPPHEDGENAGIVSIPKPGAFRPFTDAAAAATGSENQVGRGASLGPKTLASETYTHESSEPADDPQQNFSSSDEPFEDGSVEAEDVCDVPHSSSSSISDQFEEEYEEEPPQPLGGRFGRINVMTPITERTFEFSTRGLPTPGEKNALETAERLAAELREEEERERGYVHDGDESDSSLASYDRPGPILQFQPANLEAIEERTGTLSLSDALAVVSTFRPSNPCNPFDPTIMSTLLSLLPADQDFYDLRGQDSGMLDSLQKFAAKKSRRGSGSSSKGFDDNGIIITLEGKRLKVVDKLGEGGFGAVFAARDVSSKDEEDFEEDFDEEDDEGSSMLAVKVVKPRNLWEFHVLRRIHRTLPENLRRSIILPYALYAYRDESHLLMQLCPQGTLLDIVNRAGTAGISQQGACLDELLVMFFTIEIMRFLEGMHSAGFIHGDLKIDNCLLRLEEVPGGASALSSIYQPSGEGGWKYKGIKVIDFGRALDTCLFPHGQQFTGDWPTDARDCFELRENRPWTYQTDYFGLAGIIYCMLFGKYIDVSSVTPESPYKITTPFKRYWQNDLWTRLFELLLNPCLVRQDGKLPLCEELADIRHEMEGWLQNHCNRSSNTLKGLLKKIELSVYIG